MKIIELNTDDLFLGWMAYDNEEQALKDFIRDCPAAKVAHDGAVIAMKNGDDKGRAVWEGFLRALFVCALKSGEITLSNGSTASQ